MKRIFAYLSLLFSSMLNADECSYISKDSIADDWNKATDVFLGQVISAELVGEPPFGQSLETKIRVTGVLKGNPKEEFFYKDSHSYSPSGLNVGASLIFLLYGNYKIDTCKSYLYITNGYISLNELEEHSNRADTGIANIIESILVFSEKAP